MPTIAGGRDIASVSVLVVDFIGQWWPGFLAGLTTLVSAATSLHAVMLKRDVRAAAGWAGICWLVPIVGPILYLLLGVNRIERRASTLMSAGDRPVAAGGEATDPFVQRLDRTPTLPNEAGHLAPLAHLVGRVVGLSLDRKSVV